MWTVNRFSALFNVKRADTVKIRQSRSVAAMRIRAPPKEERQTMRAIYINLEDAYQQGYADAVESVRKNAGSSRKRKPAASIT
ncbi:MAG: hypothetical protein U0L36_00945 [Acutalibacteraceae bacterium]|nr:hypothetical protein [Acutalibacteraceae bacterium]